MGGWRWLSFSFLLSLSLFSVVFWPCERFLVCYVIGDGRTRARVNEAREREKRNTGERVKGKIYANYFGKHITQYTMLMRVRTPSTKKKKAERESKRERETLIYRFFIMWELWAFIPFRRRRLFPFHFTHSPLCVPIASSAPPFDHNPADENFNFRHSLRSSLARFHSSRFPPAQLPMSCSNIVYILTHSKEEKSEEEKAPSGMRRRFFREVNNGWHTAVK